MKRDFEVVVLGLGGIGSAAAYWLSRRLGGEVLGIEQFDCGHANGGSQDHSRIIRYSYHTPGYCRLAAAAYKSWERVEKEAAEELVVRCGGLDLFPEEGSIALTDYSGSMQAAAVPFEELTAAEVMRRWPPLRLAGGTRALFQADGGLVKAADCNAAHQRLAREHGAVLRQGSRVEAIRSAGGEHDVVTPRGTFRCRRLIVAAGAWTPAILKLLDLRLPLRVTQEQVSYFRAADARGFAPERFPIWIWNDEPCFYGFPAHPTDGVKVAQDLGGREVTAESRSFDPDRENLARVEGFCRAHLPSLTEVAYTKTCLYTLTPDRDFLIDSVPGRQDCWLAVGAGHAFKFASLIGEILCELALDGRCAHELGPFRFDRPALRAADR